MEQHMKDNNLVGKKMLSFYHDAAGEWMDQCMS